MIIDRTSKEKEVRVCRCWTAWPPALRLQPLADSCVSASWPSPWWRWPPCSPATTASSRGNCPYVDIGLLRYQQRRSRTSPSAGTGGRLGLASPRLCSDSSDGRRRESPPLLCARGSGSRRFHARSDGRSILICLLIRHKTQPPNQLQQPRHAIPVPLAQPSQPAPF